MRFAFIAGLFLLANLATAADTVKVQRDGAALRKEKLSMSPVVVELKNGETIPVLQRDGKWIFSESQGKKGWANEGWLSASKGGMAKSLRGAEVAVTGDAQAGAARDAAAGKGVEPITAQIALQNGYDTKGLDRLMKLRTDIVNSGEFERFAREGNVGPYRK